MVHGKRIVRDIIEVIGLHALFCQEAFKTLRRFLAFVTR